MWGAPYFTNSLEAKRWLADYSSNFFLNFFLAELQKIFNDADDDSSGSIDKKEFKKLSKKLNIFPGEKEFETMFREVDADGGLLLISI